MTDVNFPSIALSHRRADMAVHAIGLIMILIAGTALIAKSAMLPGYALIIAAIVYVISALASNLASWSYHFLPWHAQRIKLRRIDHAAIYPSIAGTFTPFFVLAGTPWTLFLLCFSWALSAVAIWNKITNPQVKSPWSTASYLGLGAIGLAALPDLKMVPWVTLWCVLGGAFAYVLGTVFYARKTMPLRYATWHMCVNIGSVLMFIGVWYALFPPISGS